MNKVFKSLHANAIWVLLSAEIMLCPILATAHGWKAPSDAAQIPNPIEYSKKSIRSGEEIYGGSCAGCHGASGKGDGPLAKKLNPKPPNLLKRLKNHSEGDFFWKIANGRSLMPGFKEQLSDKQIWEVITYIKSLTDRYFSHINRES